ncbi:MAG: hypothetical protein NTW87_02730 [Planctomycetota bacterium]|nr:hypothetical protein [Planctomycetota bacterium]
MRRSSALLAACVCLAWNVARAGDAVTVLLDDFENVGGGTKWVVVGVQGHNLKPEVAGVATGGHDGRACAQVSVGAGSALSIRQEFGKGFVGNGDKECLILPGAPVKLGLWVKGNGSATRLTVQCTGIMMEKRKKKEKGQEIEVVEEAVRGKDVDFGTLERAEWNCVEREVPAFDKPPIRLGAIRIDATKVQDAKDPNVLLDDLTLTTQGTKEAPFYVVFERLGLERELGANEPFAVRLKLQNLLPQKRSLKVNVDVTTGKTAVMSHAETLKNKTLDVSLAPGEMKSWRFEYQYPAGIYNGYLSILDAATNEPLADRRIEYAVFPKAGGTQSKDFCVYNSGLSPLVLTRNAGPRLLLFQGLEPYGLGGPTHAAFMTQKGVQVVGGGKDLPVADMSEAWMLFWYNGAVGWDKLVRPPYLLDIPMLVVFQHKCQQAKPAGTGWEFAFAGECGHVATVPLYGVSYVRATTTTAWDKGLPDDVVKRCRLIAEVSREHPLSVEEKFRVDPIADAVTIRNRFEFLSIDDDWETLHRKVAPLEYMTAVVNRLNWKPLAVEGKLLDLDMPVGQGLWAGVEGANDLTYTLSGVLKYINLLEQPKQIPPDDPLLAEARKNFDVNGALWHRFHNSWWAEENLRSAGAIGHVFPYLDENAQKYARVAGRAVAAYTLNPNNLVFEYDNTKGVSFALDGQNYERMGWCDANATSNEGLRAAYQYTVGTGDRELVRQRWPFIKSFYNVPLRMSHWGDSGYNSGGGDTFGSNLNGTISFARMAYWVGDDDSYKFSCYHAAKQFLALYGVCVAYPKWVVEKNMWGTLQETFEARDENGKIALFRRGIQEKDKVIKGPLVALEDIPFTDLRGGNMGIVPWCMVQRSSDSQERFLKDHAPAYSKYMIDGLPKKWAPQWHQAVYVDQTKPPDIKQLLGPTWLNDSVGPSVTPNLEGWDFVFDTPLPERRAKLEKFCRNNGGIRGKEFDIILAGLEQKYRTLWDGEAWRPKPDSSFRLGIEKAASAAWCPSMVIATPKFRWPTLGWNGLTPPRQPKTNSIGVVPLCGIVPDDRRISFAAATDTPNWSGSVWAADYLNYPVLTFAADLEKLPLYLQSLVIERGLDHAADHVKNILSQSELEWNVTGPFPYSQASDFDKAWPPEEKIDLAADYGVVKIGKDYAVKWKKAKARMYFVDFNSLFEANRESYVENAQVYAALWVKCPDERDMKIALGSDDGPKVWVNGALVWKNWVHRGSVMDEDVFPVHLKRGWNSVLLKVFNRNYGCGFEFYMRFVDDRLLPFGDLEFSSQPAKE